jgi:hypothetical protein
VRHTCVCHYNTTILVAGNLVRNNKTPWAVGDIWQSQWQCAKHPSGSCLVCQSATLSDQVGVVSSLSWGSLLSRCLQSIGDNRHSPVVSLFLVCCYLDYPLVGYLSCRQEPGKEAVWWWRVGAATLI